MYELVYFSTMVYEYLPAIMVITVNMENLLALHTENTNNGSVRIYVHLDLVLPRKHTFRETYGALALAPCLAG